MTISLEVVEGPDLAPTAPKVWQLSHSQKTSYLRCPNQFRLERAGYPVQPGFARLAGSAFHSATDLVDYDFWHNDYQVTDLDCKTYWCECFLREINEAKQDFPDTELWQVSGRRTKAAPNKEDMAWWMEAGAGMVIAYRDFRLQEIAVGYDIMELPSGGPAIEVELWIPLGDNVIIHGFVDRIMAQGDQIVIRDNKTGREPLDTSQLGIYRLGVQKEFGLTADWGDYYLARQGAAGTPVPLGHYTEDYLTEQFGFLAKAKEQQIYPANPGQACSTCGVKNACAAVGGVEAEQWRFSMPK